jgi:hypothetical protein
MAMSEELLFIDVYCPNGVSDEYTNFKISFGLRQPVAMYIISR